MRLLDRPSELALFVHIIEREILLGQMAISFGGLGGTIVDVSSSPDKGEARARLKTDALIACIVLVRPAP